MSETLVFRYFHPIFAETLIYNNAESLFAILTILIQRKIRPILTTLILSLSLQTLMHSQNPSFISLLTALIDSHSFLFHISITLIDSNINPLFMNAKSLVTTMLTLILLSSPYRILEP